MKILDLPDYHEENEIYFEEDLKMASFGIVVFAAMSALFCISDFYTFGAAEVFYKLVGVRGVMLVSSLVILYYMKKPKARSSYSVLVFLWLMVYSLKLMTTDLLCPQHHLLNTSHHLLTVVAIYVIFHNHFRLQLLPAMLISVFSLSNAFNEHMQVPEGTFFILFLTFVAMNALGVMVSLSLRKYRSEQMALNVQQQRMSKMLEKIAFIDDLTGLFNRRKIMEIFEREYGRVKRYDNMLAVMMLDIDHFKHVNDKYGHDAGDCVLVEFAKRVKSQIRETDFVGRFGGEEFLVVMPETDLSGAHVVAERIKQMLDETEVSLGSSRIKVTSSMGISMVRSSDMAKEDSLKRADESLYMAKKAGRDTICAENEVLVKKDSTYYTP